MKKLSFFALAIAGMLFTACSDKDLAAGEAPQGELRPEGYMALSLNLPTTPMVRAANDDFDDGKDEEYNVTDCALLLFQGGTESNATLLNAQAILLPNADNDNLVDNITTSYKLTARVKDFNNDGSNNLYALALLNYKDIMSIGTDGMPTFKNVIVNGEKKSEYKLGTTAKLADLQTMEIDGTDLTTRGGSTTKNYFFMTNAVLSTAKGGTNAEAAVTGTTFAPETLVQLAKMENTKIFESKAEAEADGNSAGDIIVERAVAKATLKLASTANEVVIGTGETAKHYAIVNPMWTIDNKQSTSYVARNPGTTDATTKNIKYHTYKSGGSNNYRFIGNASVNEHGTSGNHGLSTDYYRTYWCIDPLYNNKNDIATGKTIDDYMVAASSYSSVGDNPLYCYENTFDVENQSYKNTTRAIVKVELSNLKKFWTVNGDDNVLTTETEATSHIIATIANNSDIVEVFDDNLNEGGSYEDRSELFDVTYKRNDVTGQLEVTDLKLSSTATGMIGTGKAFKSDLTSAFEGIAGEVIEYVNERVVVRQYQGATDADNAVMYYVLRFKHFAGSPQTATGPAADDLAPWNIKTVPGDEAGAQNKYTNNWEGKIQSGGTDKSYPAGITGETAEQNYLGRYGMVRNNWYDVEVTGFSKLGYPADPSGQANNPKFDEPDTPDDSIQEYLSAKIHVLSWAKRTQSWGF